MLVTRNNLICNNELINLANIFMSISEYLSAMMDDTVTMECDHYLEDHGLEIQDHFDWEFDWDRGMKLIAADAVEFLKQELSAEFLAAVKIEAHPTELPKSGVDYNPDYLPALVTIDPDRLLKLWGDREINDGRNISGFIRTADDRYWTTVKVLEALIWEELGDYGTEMFAGYIAENYDIDDCVSHPEIEAHYETDNPSYMCKCFTPDKG